jgi:hypothetical protein
MKKRITATQILITSYKPNLAHAVLILGALNPDVSRKSALILGLRFLQRGKNAVWNSPPLYIFNYLADLQETYYEHYDTRDYSIFLLYNTIISIPTQQSYELLSWE